MAQGRLDRDQFFEKLAEMEAADLKKALWTLYWRGAAPCGNVSRPSLTHRARKCAIAA